MANQEMERALRFAGYEVNHEWGTDGHNNEHATRVFPKAMRWLWKDWPKPVTVGRGSPQLRQILIASQKWQVVAGRYHSPRGLTANREADVFFTEPPGPLRWVDPAPLTMDKIGQDGRVRVVSRPENFGHGNGQAFGPDGRLYEMSDFGPPSSMGGDAITRIIRRTGDRGHLVVLHNGLVYVTGARMGPAVPEDPTQSTQWWDVDSTRKARVLGAGLKSATGMAVSPDQTLLYVADGASHWVYSCQIQPDGSLRHKQKYYHLYVPDTADDSGADGMCVDRDGRLYIATRMGIQVCDQAGRVNCIIPVPHGRPTDICFGGRDFDTLFVTCGDRIYKRKVKARGAPAFAKPHKPVPPRL
ncbi:MAG TPA: SMP-30/gluconolactonase/LRE family protein, partial [Gemmataceae bacterium]|nr:SMP-30/gluconolactonase/LRE family protein [Gemmataceae bacterium]